MVGQRGLERLHLGQVLLGLPEVGRSFCALVGAGRRGELGAQLGDLGGHWRTWSWMRLRPLRTIASRVMSLVTISAFG